MCSTTTTAASHVAAVWFGELSAVLSGKRRPAMAPTESHAEHQQRQMGEAVHAKTKGAAAGKPGIERKETAGGGGGMSDETVYLLLDRFTPS
jgi:hypothetical protein